MNTRTVDLMAKEFGVYFRLFERNLRVLDGGMNAHERWGKDGYGAAYRETIAEHTSKMNTLVIFMLRIEYGTNTRGMLGDLLVCSHTHDWAEARQGDITLPKKTAPRQVEENTTFLEIVSHMFPPDMRRFFPLPLDQRTGVSEEAQEFWVVCEHVGYLIYAYEQVRCMDDPQGDYESIVREQRRFLKPYENKYYSVRCFLHFLTLKSLET